METFLISDTHFGHRNILSFKREDGTPLRDFSSVEEMDEHMVTCWNSVVKKNDKVYHVGDVAFSKAKPFLELIPRLNGRKILIKGNHDNWFSLGTYHSVFADVRAYHVLDKILLAHIPIHPLSLSRWKGQVHGHTHYRVLEDPLYFNVSVENINYTPVSFDRVREYFASVN